MYFYSVYGPRERSGFNSYGTVIETFRQNYLQGKPFEVAEPGTQKRAFTHVLDTVSGILIAGEKGENDEFGICAEDTHTLLDVTHMLGGEVVIVPRTKSTRSNEAVDSSKIKALGWVQKYSLIKYLEDTKTQK